MLGDDRPDSDAQAPLLAQTDQDITENQLTETPRKAPKNVRLRARCAPVVDLARLGQQRVSELPEMLGKHGEDREWEPLNQA